MIINRNFKNNKRAEKAAALLALAADKGGSYGRCLLAEEMAALVDNRCGKEEQAIFMQHLCCCEKCYKEWLNLKKTADRKVNEDRVVRLSRIKKYSFIGSALAVAASVAVFLNISHLPYTFIDKSYEEAVQMQPGTESGESIVPQFKLEAEEMEKAVPVAVDSQVKERRENRKIPADTGDESLPEKKGLSVPATKPVARLMKETVQAGGVGGGDTLIDVDSDVDSWLEQLRKNCLADRQEADFWAKMHLEGKNLLEKKKGLLPRNKEQKVLAALALLTAMDTESVTDQCRQLLAALAEDEESS